MFSYSIGERNILQTVLLSYHFVRFYFISALQSDNNSNTVYGLTAQAEMSLRWAQNISVPENINSIFLTFF